MPWFAGMSEMKYGRFLLYDLIGVMGWTAASIAIGYAAGESWRAVAATVGSASAYVISALLALLAFVALRKRMRQRAALRKSSVVRVGLTGNIASGKSAVTEIWRSLGAAIIDADVLARRAVETGTPGYERVVREFGPAVVKDGELDRAALRAAVFADDEKRKRLEAIIHPEVGRLRHEQDAELVRAGHRVIVNDVPLLFETGMENEFDIVVLVDAPEAERIARIVRDRGLSQEEAGRMVAAQMPAREKRLPATFVIDNDGTLDELRTKAEGIWSEIQEAAR
jgi:dephospho-CoA kinase